jgi:pimeloyl-ACP methyl ester carboxylesterase
MNGLETLWIRQRMKSRGFAPRAFRYESLHASVEQVVDDLSAELARLPPPVHLVGHSLGGLMLLKLFEFRPNQPPGRVVLMGSPASGSRAARSVSGWAIGPSVLGPLALAELVRDGPRRWTQPRELGVIAGCTSAGLGRLVAELPQPNDGTVAVEETRIEGMTDHVVLPVTHTGMLVSASVAEHVARFLRSGRFQEEGSDPGPRRESDPFWGLTPPDH